MTLLNEICDSSRLVCVFFPNILLDRGNSCQFLAKSRMTLWRERGLEVGRLEFSRRKAVAGEGGGDTAVLARDLCFHHIFNDFKYHSTFSVIENKKQ